MALLHLSALQPPRRRVLQLLGSAGLGGAQESVVALLLRLDRSRFAVEAASLTDGPTVRRLRELGMTVSLFDGADDAAVIQQLVAHLRRREIDLLHAHLFRAELLGARAARAGGTPVVVGTVHSSRVRSPSDVAALAAVTPRLDHLIAPSAAIAAKVRREGRGAVPVTIVPNGVDLHRFIPRRSPRHRSMLGIPGSAFVVGVVARLEPEKGHRYLIEAFGRVVAAVPDAWLLVVGDGSEGHALRARVAALPRPACERVVFAGPRRDVAALTAVLDLAVLPSLREAQGLAVLEAMAAGVPVVASAVGGIPETIRDGAEGRLVPPRDPGVLAEAIIELAHRPDLRQRMAHAARRRVEDRFSVETAVRRIEAIYVEELAGAGLMAADSPLARISAPVA